jgi:thioesterase domain-containing protein
VIGGHSFGGVVSYEIAQQLRAAGQEVAMLFILDSALPNLGRRGLADRAASVLACLRGLPYAPSALARQLRQDPERFRRDAWHKLRFTGSKVLARIAPRRPAAAAPGAGKPSDALRGVLDVAAVVEMTNWPENNRRIAERHYRAVLAYRPEPYAGRVTLFRSRFQSPFLGLGFRMGWERVARGGVEVLTVPGGHLSMLVPPAVDVLADKMRSALAGTRAGAKR